VAIFDLTTRSLKNVALYDAFVCISSDNESTYLAHRIRLQAGTKRRPFVTRSNIATASFLV